MPKYTYKLTNGKTMSLEGDTMPSDEEVESLAKQNKVELLPATSTPKLNDKSNIPISKPEIPSSNTDKILPSNTDEGWMEKGFHAINKSLTDFPSRMANKISEYVNPEKTTRGLKGIGSAYIESLGNQITGLASPLNAGLMALTGGQSIAAKAGLSNIANALNLGNRAVSGLVAAEGAHRVYKGDTLTDKLSGLPEVALGILGMRSALPKIAESISNPSEIKNVINPSEIKSPEIKGWFNSKDELEAIKQRELSKIENRPPGTGYNADTGQVVPLEPSDKSITNTKPRYRLDTKSGMGIPIDEQGNQIGPAVGPKGEQIRPDLIDASKYNRTNKTPASSSSNKLPNGFSTNIKTPTNEPPININDKSGIVQNIYDLPRGLMSVDPPFMTSAAFRQAGKYAGTKEWFKAFGQAAKAYGSKAAADAQEAARLERPLFKPTTLPNGELGPSYAEQVGLRRGNLSKYSQRDEQIKGELAEQIPVYGKAVAASNRAYTAFINHVGDTKFEDMIDTATKLSKTNKLGGIMGGSGSTPNPMTDLTAGKAIADFVNTSLNRGKLGIEAGSHELDLEKHARLLSNTFFSPRTISSQVRMLNPSTYVMASPQIRKEYLAGMVRQVGLWWSMAQLAEWGGATVSKDPTSADFGKIKIGNTRIDPPGGLQQYLVLGAKNAAQGSTSTNTGKFTPFGKEYKPETTGTSLLDFGINRLHPTAKAAWDLVNAQPSKPFHVGDRAIQLAVPMFSDDLMSVIKDDPSLAPIVLGASGLGMGTQNYTRGSFGKPTFLPEEYDWNIGAKK